MFDFPRNLKKMFIILLFFLISFSGVENQSHFETLETNNSFALTYPLNYNNESSCYQITIGIQNGSDTEPIISFPMDLSTNSPYFNFMEKNVSLNSTNQINSTLSLYFPNNISLKNQSILIETSKTSNKYFSVEDFQGIFGLAPFQTQNSSLQYLTLREILTYFQNQGLFNHTMFSLYFGSSPERSNDSSIIFGGVNRSLLGNDLVYYLNRSQGNNWTFTMAGLEIIYTQEKLTQAEVFSDLETNIDISTPNILLPPTIFNQLLTIFSKLYITCSLLKSENTLICVDQYTFLVNEYPFMAIFFTSELFLLMNPAKLQYNCGQTAKNLRSCYLRVGLSSENNTVFLGQIFLKHTYSIFNLENNTIGISFANFTTISVGTADDSMNYTFYVLLTFWGMTMVGCGLYFKSHLIRMNIMTNKITKIFYDKVRNAIRGNQQQVDIEDSEDSEEEAPANNSNLLNNMNNNNNANNANL